MIYDGFLFFNEFDLLEIRLNELWDVVDRFILVESNLTHSGKEKPLAFMEKRHLFDKYLSKIIHVKVLDMPVTQVTWDREIHQRNSIIRGIHRETAKLDDLLIVSDVDEIPRAAALAKVAPSVHKPLQFRMSSYGTYVNSPTGPWSYAKIAPLRFFWDGLSPQHLRHANCIEIPEGGWHFSYAGGAKRVSEKMSAFSHQEEAVQRFNKEDVIAANMARGIGVFGGPLSFQPLDETFPKYLVENQEKFRHLIGPG